MTRTVIMPLVVVATFILSGCDTNKSSRQTPLSGFKENVFDFPLGDINSLFAVALEETDESVIAEIKEVLFADEQIFILDGKTMNILIFNLKGKYLAKVSAIGRGPGEYLRGIRSFDLDRIRKEIIIYDSAQRKLIRYTYGGQFLRENRLADYRGLEFAYIGSDNYVFRMHLGSSEIVVTDSVGNILSVPHPREIKYDSLLVVPSSPFFAKTCNGTPFYIPMWDDKIYSVTPSGVLIAEDFGLKSEMLVDEKDISIFKREADKIFERYYNGPGLRIKRYSYFQRLVVNSDNIYYLRNTFLDNSRTDLWVTGRFGHGVFKYGRYPYTSFTVSPGDTMPAFRITNITDTLKVDWYPTWTYKDMFVIQISKSFIRRHFPVIYNSLPDISTDNPYLLFYRTIF